MQKMSTLAAAVLLICAATASSQEPEPRRLPPPPLALARLTVSEAGWVDVRASEEGVESFDDADMRGIHAVLRRGAQRSGLSYVGFAARYARRVIGGIGYLPRPWLRDLSPDGREPEGWEQVSWVRRGDVLVRQPPVAWRAYRERWLRTYRRAVEVYTLDMDNWEEWGPCDQQPDHWGGDMDRDRAQRIGLVPITCEGTANTFYITPRRMED